MENSGELPCFLLKIGVFFEDKSVLHESNKGLISAVKGEKMVRSSPLSLKKKNLLTHLLSFQTCCAAKTNTLKALNDDISVAV